MYPRCVGGRVYPRTQLPETLWTFRCWSPSPSGACSSWSLLSCLFHQVSPRAVCGCPLAPWWRFRGATGWSVHRCGRLRPADQEDALLFSCKVFAATRRTTYEFICSFQALHLDANMKGSGLAVVSGGTVPGFPLLPLFSVTGMMYDSVKTDTAEFQLSTRRKYIVIARVLISGLVTLATPENFQ